MVLGTVVMTENPTPLAAAAKFNEVRLSGNLKIKEQLLENIFLYLATCLPVCTQHGDGHGNCKDGKAKLVRPLQTQQLGNVLLNRVH